jgi:hypothetical protein
MSTKIYQRFESLNSDKTVAEAAQIFDENLKQDQETINKNTKEALNSLVSTDLYDMCKAGINPKFLGFMVAAFDPSETTPSESYGDREFALAWYPYLIDCTDNTGTTTKAKELMRNNWLRYADGSYAPTVGITPSQESEEGRTLQPWETTNQDYSIGLGRKEDVWVIDGVKGLSGKYWRGIFSKAITWDGIDTTPYKLSRTAIAPGPGTILQTAANNTSRFMRHFFYVYDGNTHTKTLNGGYNGYSNLITEFNETGRSYPRTGDANQVTNMQWARNNNSDTQVAYPCAEAGLFATNAFILSMELAYATKDLHNENLFGGGISSNDTCNASNWETKGGIKVTSPDGTVNYYNYNSNPVFRTSSGGSTDLSNWLSQYRSLLQTNEAQMAASYFFELQASDDSMSLGDEFEFYGHTYSVVAVNDEQDIMSLRVRSTRIIEKELYNTSGEAGTYKIEVNLVQPLVAGWDGWGNIWSYNGGGYEKLGIPKVGATSGCTGNDVTIWLQPDQTKWPYETTITKDKEELFQCEDPANGFINLGTFQNIGNDYSAERVGFTDWKIAKGASLHTKECSYVWDNNYWSTDSTKKTRLKCLRRGRAISDCAAPRSFNSHDSASYTNSYLGCSACWLISD